MVDLNLVQSTWFLSALIQIQIWNFWWRLLFSAADLDIYPYLLIKRIISILNGIHVSVWNLWWNPLWSYWRQEMHTSFGEYKVGGARGMLPLLVNFSFIFLVFDKNLVNDMFLPENLEPTPPVWEILDPPLTMLRNPAKIRNVSCDNLKFVMVKLNVYD